MRSKIASKDNMIAEMFEIALHLEAPWELTHIEFDDQDQSWHLFVDFKRRSTFSCPRCGASSKAYDAEKKSWRHLDFWDWKTFLHARVPRTDWDELPSLMSRFFLGEYVCGNMSTKDVRSWE